MPGTAPAAKSPAGGGTAAALPFRSRLAAPATAADGKRLAPPGVLYVLERVSIETPAGIRALVPGDSVKLLQRKPNKLKVTDGSTDFELAPEKLTNDFEVALAAEKQDVARYPRRR
jgi:hypothetical protein